MKPLKIYLSDLSPDVKEQTAMRLSLFVTSWWQWATAPTSL